LSVLLCIPVAIACVLNGKQHQPANGNGKQPVEVPSLDVPDAPWERAFFEELEERTSRAGISDLRKTVLPDRDLEMRFWYDHFEDIQGLILRRSGGSWSATYLKQKSHRDLAFETKATGPPKAGWEDVWTRLVSAGILTLPDQSQTNCKSEALDGVGYVVETSANGKYKTFRYGNPQLLNCDQARLVQSIEMIVGEAFGLADLQK
jgi:hypothetical protein